MSTQLFGVLYITLMGMVDTMLAPILWWALPSGPAVFRPKPTNASTYAWLPDTISEVNCPNLLLTWMKIPLTFCFCSRTFLVMPKTWLLPVGN
ncbi:hypothetical protein DSO57_1002176 [Entomophthora muscae]|uniref:Uncharacterized protein n=1 Tax=Entomophthora muscae TaxID=34485 RepID=A0ACC2T8K6_9FUNG|nr:hypothetical protein DSO57_1002176 [Entomophthora muscae]